MHPHFLIGFRYWYRIDFTVIRYSQDEACLELMTTDCIVSLQDMGAAGLTSSSVEIAAKGEIGLLLDLDKVPMRETGMVPYEIMLSESQERMLVILKPGQANPAAAALVDYLKSDAARATLRGYGYVFQ